MSSQLKTSAVISYFTVIFNIIAGLLYTPWMIGEIGKDNYGLYSLVVVFISYFLVDFGLGSTISTYIAKAHASGDHGKVRSIVGLSYKAYFIISAVIATFLVVAYVWLPDIFGTFTDSQLHSLKIIYLIAGFFSVCSFPLMPLNGILLATGNFIFLKCADLINKVLCIGLIVLCLTFDYGLYALVTVNSVCAFLLSLVKLIFVKRRLDIGFEIRSESNSRLLREIAQFSGWVFVISVAQRLIVNIAPTIIGAFVGVTEIAIFSIGVAIEGYIYTFANCLNGLFIPKVSGYVIEKRSREEITSSLIKVGRIQLYIIGLIICGFFALGKSFIRLWLGVDFSQSYYICLFLITPNIVLLTQEIASTLVFVENKVKMRAIIYICGGMFSSILEIILAPKFGAIGCAFAIFLTLVLITIALNLTYVRQLHLNMWRFFRNCHLRIVPVLSIPALIFYIFSSYWMIDSWLFFIGYALAFVLIEALLLYSFCFNTDEKKLVKLR